MIELTRDAIITAIDFDEAFDIAQIAENANCEYGVGEVGKFRKEIWVRIVFYTDSERERFDSGLGKYLEARNSFLTKKGYV